MMMEAQLQQKEKRGGILNQLEQRCKQTRRSSAVSHSILDTSQQDKQVSLTFYILGKCLHERKSYTDILKAFIELDVKKHEDYAKRLVHISHDRLYQWRAYFHNPRMINLWQALRLIETRPYLAFQHDPSLRDNPMNPIQPFGQDYLMSVVAQLTNIIYTVYDGIVKVLCFYRANGIKENNREFAERSIKPCLEQGSAVSGNLKTIFNNATAMLMRYRLKEYATDCFTTTDLYTNNSEEIIDILGQLLRRELTIYSAKTETLALKVLCLGVGRKLVKHFNGSCDHDTVKKLLVNLNGLLNIDDIDEYEAKLKQCWSKAYSIVNADATDYMVYIDYLTKMLKRQLGDESMLVCLIEQIKSPKSSKIPKPKQYLQVCLMVQEIYLATKTCNRYLTIPDDSTSPLNDSFFGEAVSRFQTAILFHQLDVEIADCLTCKNQPLGRAQGAQLSPTLRVAKLKPNKINNNTSEKKVANDFGLG